MSKREHWQDEERWSPEDEAEARWESLHGVPWAYQTSQGIDNDDDEE